MQAKYLRNSPDTKTRDKVDLVIFSYDRPLQLYALLESSEKYLKGLHSIHVVLRTSEKKYSSAYRHVFKHFPYVKVHKQAKNYLARTFKKRTFDAVFGKKSKARYFMFAVDDMIVTDYVNLTKCVNAMRKYRPWFFSLRIGKNIHLDTIQNIPSPPPPHKKSKNMIKWQFADGKGAWGYPNSTDMTIYRKKDIRYFLKKGRYSNPNTMEGAWMLRGAKRKRGLSFVHSKVINIPLNTVNTSWTLPNMNVSPHELLEHFNAGLKIDIDTFFKVRNYATHMNYTPTFTQRQHYRTKKNLNVTREIVFKPQS
jgi:hypothetical protein